MIWEAMVGEELPCKAQTLYYMDYFVTFSLFNLLYVYFILLWVLISNHYFPLSDIK